MTYLIIFLSQLTFNILKVLEIRFTYERRVARLMVNSVLINLVSLLSVYYSLDLLINKGDWWVLAFYIAGSAAGKYLGISIPGPGRRRAQARTAAQEPTEKKPTHGTQTRPVGAEG